MTVDDLPWTSEFSFLEWFPHEPLADKRTEISFANKSFFEIWWHGEVRLLRIFFFGWGHKSSGGSCSVALPRVPVPESCEMGSCSMSCCEVPPKGRVPMNGGLAKHVPHTPLG